MRYGAIPRAFTLTTAKEALSAQSSSQSPGNMRARTAPALLLLAILASLQWMADGCEPGEMHNGCKIYGNSCICGYGCRTDYIYKTRRECSGALKERSSNICSRRPCVRGICLQTMQDPGFTCKCEGTGFYGMRCEKACPTVPMRGLVFPHECIVI